MIQHSQRQLRKVLGLFSFREAHDIAGRKGFYLLSLILSVITLSVIAAAILVLYNSEVSHERQNLHLMANSQARLIEVVAEHELLGQLKTQFSAGFQNFRDSGDIIEQAMRGTMTQLIDAHEKIKGFGTTGEFAIAKREDANIEFLLSQRLLNRSIPSPVPLNSDLAVPMRLALSGQSGTIIALDYRGREVLAAYQSVDLLSIGIVVKKDISELRFPFILAGIVASVLGLLLICGGIFLIDRFTSPLIRKLQKSEERLGLALEGTEQGLWDWDIKSDTITISKGWTKMLGYEHEEIGKRPAQRFNLIHPEDRAHKIDNLEKHLSGKNPFYECEYRMKTKTGDWLWIHDKGKIVANDNDGKPLRMTGTHIDVTARKRSEREREELNQSLRQLAAFAINNPGPVLRTDLQGTICDANPASFATFGQDLTGEMLSTVFPGNESLFAKSVSECLPIQFEHEIDTKIFLFTVACDTTISSTFVYGIDISKRKRMEIELCKLTQAVEQSPVSIFITDLKGNIEYVNPRFEKLTGYTASEVTGKNPSIWSSGKQPEETYSVMWNTIKNGGLWSGEIQNKKKNGELFWETVTICQVKGDDGKATHYLAVNEDITERKRLEYELALSRQLESIGVLAGGIAHDFNNYLAAILSNVSLIKLDTDPGNPIYSYLEDVEKATVLAEGLARQLLTFSKGGEPIKKVTSIEDLIKNSASFVLSGSNAGLVCSLTEGLEPVEIDIGQMSQVIQNMVINASQAMPEGGMIHVNADKICVYHGDSLPLEAGQYVMISIEDEGAGIPPEHLAKIFDPYFTTKESGNGLGLATSYSIVKRHGGCIQVESFPDSGTIFRIYLPACDATTTTATDESIETIHFGVGKILVMDDEGFIRDIVCAILSRQGYTVDCASNGTEAIQMFEQAREEKSSYDAVILDLTIPGGMGGKKVVAELKRIDPDVKAIVSSGYSDDAVMADLEKYGFAAVLVKPYTAKALAGVVFDTLADVETIAIT